MHVPYTFIRIHDHTIYLLSRKACVDAAVSLLHSCYSFSFMAQELPRVAAVHQIVILNSGSAGLDSTRCDELIHLCNTNPGPCCLAPFQALIIIEAELTALDRLVQ